MTPQPGVAGSQQATTSADQHQSNARSRAAGAPGNGARLGAVPVQQQQQAPYVRYSSPPIQQQQHQQQAHSPYDASGYPAAASFGSAMDGGANSPYGYGGQGAPNNGFYNGGARGGPGGQGQGMPGPFGNFLSNDPNVNMTAQMGMHMASVGGEYVQKNLGGYLPTMSNLRPYYDVSGSYVISKLRVILFPWRHRPWSRAHHRAFMAGGEQNGGEWPGNSGSSGQGSGKRGVASLRGYAAPRDDVMAVDHYLPVMSFVTYVLLIAVTLGLSHKFRPEILGLTASRALVVVALELLVLRLGLYLLNVPSDHYGILDLAAYSGYKFVPACVTLSTTVLAPLTSRSSTTSSSGGVSSLVWWLTFLYTHAALAFFLLRSLRHIILPDAASLPPGLANAGAAGSGVATLSHAQRARRVQLLFLVAVLQFVLGAGLCFRVAG